MAVSKEVIDMATKAGADLLLVSSNTSLRKQVHAQQQLIQQLEGDLAQSQHAWRGRVEQVKEYRALLKEAENSNCQLREQVNNLLSELARARSSETTPGSKQFQREELLAGLLEQMEQRAAHYAQTHHAYTFTRGYLRVGKERMKAALVRYEQQLTGRASLFTIGADAFNEFWKHQALCKSAPGRNQQADAFLLD